MRSKIELVRPRHSYDAARPWSSRRQSSTETLPKELRELCSTLSFALRHLRRSGQVRRDVPLAMATRSV
ncbi:hypothetical protein BQ8794_240306 [Mesorhizobium prunaredense]|uniref:Transposase n=1 Tax=Mesorhizobium prunaredense TaxID=1631249 RepID=A0A1R3VBE7_9HYPH|nr:hypothetical protein BQ8794_240306 [Mesorhizobium prunaredense]